MISLSVKWAASVGVRWLVRLLISIGAIALAGGSVRAQSVTVSTFVGQTGVSGSTDGPSGVARFVGPAGLVCDSAGTLYITDNHTIRKITTAGVVSTLAGSPGMNGTVDGVGPAARFDAPRGIGVDAAGNVYVGEQQNCAVRKITPGGVVTTFAGIAGRSGLSDGVGSEARFANPSALTVDSAGNVYVGDSTRVRKITPAGVVSTLAGHTTAGNSDGAGTNARFGGIIVGIAVDAAGFVYVGDFLNQTIRRITPAGIVTTLAGRTGIAGSMDGPAATATFNQPISLTVDGVGNVYVGEGQNQLLRRISAAGVVTTLAGFAEQSGFSDGVGVNVRFNGVFGLGFGDGVIFMADAGGRTIRRAIGLPVAPRVVVSPSNQTAPGGQTATFIIAANGNPALTFQWQRLAAGSNTWTNLSASPTYPNVTGAILLVANASLAMNGDQFRCVVSNTLGTDTSAAARLSVDAPVVVVPLRMTTLAGRAGVGGIAGDDGQGAAARFSVPQGIAVDAAGNVYIADLFNHRIRKMTPTGLVTTLAGGGSGSSDGVGSAARFSQPTAVAVDRAGNVFVAEGFNSTIRKVTPAGVVTTFAGRAGERGTSDGPGATARFSSPHGVAVDSADNVYVADSSNHTIRRISPSGVTTTVAGSPGMYGTADGTGSVARFSNPKGLAVDPTGTIYVADWGSHVIRKITSGGVVTTLTGAAGIAGASDGRLVNARFNGPTAVSLDAAGNLWVADSGNNAIRRITSSGIVSTVAGLLPSAGNANTMGTADGIGTAARFSQPSGIAVDKSGNVYVADSANSTIRKGVTVATVKEGQAVELSVLGGTDGHGIYQWRKDAQPIAGATRERYTVQAARAADNGEYAVEVMTDSGPALSEPVLVSVEGSRIVNLSIRSEAGRGPQTLIVGFVVSGKNMPLLVRSIGPSLAQFGVRLGLTDPQLALQGGSTVNLTNDNWGAAADIALASARVGAFPLVGTSLDSALLASLDAGTFTVQSIGANDSTGVALVELYDAGGSSTSRLSNVSARSQVGAGDNILIAGFAIAGETPRTVLIRGIGPSLTRFNVAGALADPELRLYDGSGGLRARNDNWDEGGNSAALGEAAQSIGAFALAPDSKDAVLLVRLDPGTYSTHLAGVGGATGVGLVEVYEVP
jgi:sugar lactone lactonase YvrE